VWLVLLGLEQVKNANPRYTNTHKKKEGDKDLRGSCSWLAPVPTSGIRALGNAWASIGEVNLNLELGS